jgi:hypothetical protein
MNDMHERSDLNHSPWVRLVLVNFATIICNAGSNVISRVLIGPPIHPSKSTVKLLFRLCL